MDMADKAILKLPYGENWITFSLPAKNLLGVLVPPKIEAEGDVGAAVARALREPIGLPPLAELIAQRRPDSILVLLSDQTRIVPRYSIMLRVLLDECLRSGVAQARIRLLIASGTHRSPTCEERDAIYGRDLVDKFHLFSHDCDQDSISLGTLSSGHPLELNRLLLTHDLIIATGKITPHYLAGYSGGRKAVLPGCASRQTIARNHAMVVRGKSGPGVLAGNPIHQEMDEAAERAGLGFILNLVPTPQEEVAGVFAGDFRKAFAEGTACCRRAWAAAFRRPAHCVVAVAGGHPVDVNLYQLQRVLNHVAPAARPGGSIVLVGRCPEGVGQEVFGQWMERYSLSEILSMPESGIASEAHRAYASARVMNQCEVIVVSDMDPQRLGRMKFRGYRSLDEAMDYIREKHGPDFECYVVPQGYATMLVPEDEEKA